MLLHLLGKEELHRRGPAHPSLQGDLGIGLDVDLHSLGAAFEFLEHAFELGLEHVAGATTRGGVDHQERLRAVVVELAQGVGPLLPEGLGVVVVGIALEGTHRFARRSRLHLLPSHRDRQSVVAEPAFGGEGRLAATGCGGDALAPFRIRHIPGGEHSVQLRFGPAGPGDQVAPLIQGDLALQQAGVGGVADGIEQPPHGQVLGAASDSVPQDDRAQPVGIACRSSSRHIHQFAVPMQADRRIGQHPIGHGGTGPKPITAHDQMHVASVLGEVDRFLAGGITPPNYSQLLAAKLGGGAVTDGAGADPAAPEALLLGQMKSVRTGASRQDEGMGVDGLGFAGVDAERTHAEINPIGIGLNQMGPPTDGLGLHAVHQLRSQDAVGEAGVVLHVGGGHQLAPGDASGLEAGDQQGIEVGPGRVDGGGVARRPRADNHDVLHRRPLGAIGFNGLGRGLTHGANAEQL